MLSAAADESDYMMKQALVEEKKAAVRAGEASIEKGKGKDLLSMVGEFYLPNSCLALLGWSAHFRPLSFAVRANMDPDLKESQRMSDAEGEL
jgi:hypothetical protein